LDLDRAYRVRGNVEAVPGASRLGFALVLTLAPALACHAPGAIPKSTPRPPDAELAGKGEACEVDDDCAGDKLVCDAGACIPWTRMRGEAPEISPQELAARIEAGPIQIVDVRTGLEFRAERIEGAVHVPISKLAERLPELELDPEIPVVTICLTAHRSIPATRLLRRHGYDVVQLAGGMTAWRKAKLPRVGGSVDAPKQRGRSKP
jgi:rhodanese-related sulfurtransferase